MNNITDYTISDGLKNTMAQKIVLPSKAKNILDEKFPPQKEDRKLKPSYTTHFIFTPIYNGKNVSFRYRWIVSRKHKDVGQTIDHELDHLLEEMDEKGILEAHDMPVPYKPRFVSLIPNVNNSQGIFCLPSEVVHILVDILAKTLNLKTS